MAFHYKQNEISLCEEEPTGSGQYVCHTVFHFEENKQFTVSFEAGPHQGRFALGDDDPFHEGGFWMQAGVKKYVHQALMVPVLRSQPNGIYCTNAAQVMHMLKIMWCVNILEHVRTNDTECEQLVNEMREKEPYTWNVFLHSIKIPSDADTVSTKKTAVRFVEKLQARYIQAVQKAVAAGKASEKEVFESILEHIEGVKEALQYLRTQVKLHYWKNHCSRATKNILGLLTQAKQVEQVTGVHDHVYYADPLTVRLQQDALTQQGSTTRSPNTDKLLTRFGMHKIPLELHNNAPFPLPSTVIDAHTLTQGLLQCAFHRIQSHQLKEVPTFF